MKDMTQDQEYIDIHNSIERIKEKVRYYNANYDKLDELQKLKFHELQDRLSYYNKRFEHVEEWFGLMI